MENLTIDLENGDAMAQAKYETLLDQSSAMITVIDGESYEVLYANAAACEATKNFEGGYVASVCYRSIAHRGEPCPGCLLARQGAPAEEIREITYGSRTYRMVYKCINWGGRRALMEYSEDITEQKQVMLLAQENARQHENIIANLPTGIIVYKIENHDYKILQVNPAACRMMGIRPDRAAGTGSSGILDFVSPEDRQQVIDAAIKMAVPGVEVHYEFRSRIRGKQNAVWLAADGKSALQPDGSVYVYISYKDITDSKERELEFQQKVDFLANLNDDKLIAKGRHNLTRNLVLEFAGRQAGAIAGGKGLTYDALLPLIMDTAITDQKRQELAELFDRQHLLAAFAAGKRDFSIDYRRRMEGGHKIWATLKCSLYEEPGTYDVIAFLYTYDSTEQVQETQIISRLSSLEYGLLALIDVETHGYKVVFLMDDYKNHPEQRQGDYDAMVRNRCALPQILGDREELARQLSLSEILEQLKTRSIYQVDYSARNPDGTNRRMRFHYSYLDETQETVLYCCSDITENYERDQAQVRQVQKALREAQEANRAKSVFFSRMSHDMRTPMNGILGMTALSEGENDPAVLHDNMRKIRESGRYLLSLINDTLDIQRIESGKMKLEPQIIRTTDVVENILDMVRNAAEGKGVELRFDPGNTELDWYVRADPIRLKQVIVNLLSNAIKFTPPGGTVELTFKLLSREGMISHDVLTVRDTGVGMSEEFVKNGIFKPFSQENNAVTAQYAGSGLGLSIAKSLVELMGGRIEVESELGVGTTFTLYLDFERVDRDEARRLLHRQEKQTRDLSAVLSGKQILLAEDHPLNAEIARRLLARVGCRVVWMQNGLTARECFEASAPGEIDAILMDIRMPVMDGLEAARQIRALPRPDAKTVPIIAMTANAYDEDVRSSLAAGMNDHLGKPVEPGRMYEVLANYVSKKEP